MANLNVQRKKTTRGWIWIFGILAALAVLFFLYKNRRGAPGGITGALTFFHAPASRPGAVYQPFNS